MSHQPSFKEAKVLLTIENNMVKKHNPNNIAHLSDVVGHLDVGIRGPKHTLWMVVSYDNTGGLVRHSPKKDLSNIRRCPIE